MSSCGVYLSVRPSRSRIKIFSKLILCTSKSEAAVTSNKKLHCRYVEADYRQTLSIARPLCARGLSATAELLVKLTVGTGKQTDWM